MFKFLISNNYGDIPILNPKIIKHNPYSDSINEYTYIDQDLVKLVNQHKNKIDKYYFNKCWEKIKKYTNPYELIYITDKCSPHKSIANLDPISRSFFKMVEMFYNFIPEYIIPPKEDYVMKELIDNFPRIKTLHLCESPGGYAACVRYLRSYHPNDEIFAISIRPTSKNIPGWTKASDFLNKNPQVRILYGADNTGDLYQPENIYQTMLDVGQHSCEIITGDGGFDFSSEFNNQETNMSKLIYAQLLAALICQKKGGSFILKIFDMNYVITHNILDIIKTYYQEVYVYKPCTSRIANSEKYLVCRNYRPIDFLSWSQLLVILHLWNDLNNQGFTLDYLFSTNLLSPELELIKQINNSIIQDQITHIQETIFLIQNPPNKEWKQQNIKNQIMLATEWCQKFNIPIAD